MEHRVYLHIFPIFPVLIIYLHTFVISSACLQVTPAQIREAERNLEIMEVIIEAMTPGCFFILINAFISVEFGLIDFAY
jgi:hypothetical protein